MHLYNEGMATINPMKVYVGDRAEVAGRKGVVMYVGKAEFAAGGIVVGLRLDEKRTTSECDGKYDGERLFRCKPGGDGTGTDGTTSRLDPGASESKAPPTHPGFFFNV